MSDTAKTIRMLWLYDDLLDLYRDFGNLLVLQKRLTQTGFDVQLERKSLADQPQFLKYDFIYIGPGKARNLARAAKHFAEYADEFKQAVQAGKVILVTGNARLLLGQGFSLPDQSWVSGIGLFEYTGEDTGNVFVSDVVAKELASGQNTLCYGFVNRTAHIHSNSGPYLFTSLVGCGDGVEQENTGFEGNLTQNLFATWLLGPVLVKNPDLAAEVLKRLTGYSASYDDELERYALECTLREFELPEGLTK